MLSTAVVRHLLNQEQVKGGRCSPNTPSARHEVVSGKGNSYFFRTYICESLRDNRKGRGPRKEGRYRDGQNYPHEQSLTYIALVNVDPTDGNLTLWRLHFRGRRRSGKGDQGGIPDTVKLTDDACARTN